jgi:fluoroquinolone resistance protein
VDDEMTERRLSEDELRKEIEAKDGCAGRDLSGLDFESLIGDDPLTFKDCTISGARAKGDALSRSQWINCKIRNCEFVATDLRDAQFVRCLFFEPEAAIGVRFRFCDLTRASFSDCNLSMAHWLGGSAHEIAFADCQMRGAKFEKMDFALSTKRRRLNKARFERCLMNDAVLASLDLSSSEFRDCALAQASFEQSDLTGATLANCNLALAEVAQADFRGADLRGSDLAGFNLAELKGSSNMRISAGQQHHLLASLNIEVFPDGE